MMAFADLDTFENIVLNQNSQYLYYYILSPYYTHKDPSGIFLSKISIFSKDRGTVMKDKQLINEVLKILKTKLTKEEKKQYLEKYNLSDIEKKSIGSMLGMAIGDAMGARYEFKKVRYDTIDLEDMGKPGISNFNMEPGQWTDDTSMGLCLADSLLMNNGKLEQHDLMRRFLCWWHGGYNNAFRFNKIPRHSVGLGGNISQSFIRYKQYQEKETGAGDENTSGNGSIMRNAAIPICFHHEINIACENARKQSLVTHQGLEAKECCSLLTHIIVKIFKGEKLSDILNNLGKTFETKVKSVKYLANSMQEGTDINRNWNWRINGQYKYSPERAKKKPGYVGSYAMDNMAMSLNILYNTNNFRDALIKIVNIRGDSDSVASVVGQIAGAYYDVESIPGDWIEAINKWDDGEIALRGYMLARLHDKKSYIIEEK